MKIIRWFLSHLLLFAVIFGAGYLVYTLSPYWQDNQDKASVTKSTKLPVTPPATVNSPTIVAKEQPIEKGSIKNDTAIQDGSSKNLQTDAVSIDKEIKAENATIPEQSQSSELGPEVEQQLLADKVLEEASSVQQNKLPVPELNPEPENQEITTQITSTTSDINSKKVDAIKEVEESVKEEPAQAKIELQEEQNVIEQNSEETKPVVSDKTNEKIDEPKVASENALTPEIAENLTIEPSSTEDFQSEKEQKDVETNPESSVEAIETKFAQKDDSTQPTQPSEPVQEPSLATSSTKTKETVFEEAAKEPTIVDSEIEKKPVENNLHEDTSPKEVIEAEQVVRQDVEETPPKVSEQEQLEVAETNVTEQDKVAVSDNNEAISKVDENVESGVAQQPEPESASEIKLQVEENVIEQSLEESRSVVSDKTIEKIDEPKVASEKALTPEIAENLTIEQSSTEDFQSEKEQKDVETNPESSVEVIETKLAQKDDSTQPIQLSELVQESSLATSSTEAKETVLKEAAKEPTIVDSEIEKKSVENNLHEVTSPKEVIEAEQVVRQDVEETPPKVSEQEPIEVTETNVKEQDKVAVDGNNKAESKADENVESVAAQQPEPELLSEPKAIETLNSEIQEENTFTQTEQEPQKSELVINETKEGKEEVSKLEVKSAPLPETVEEIKEESEVTITQSEPVIDTLTVLKDTKSDPGDLPEVTDADVAASEKLVKAQVVEIPETNVEKSVGAKQAFPVETKDNEVKAEDNQVQETADPLEVVFKTRQEQLTEQLLAMLPDKEEHQAIPGILNHEQYTRSMQKRIKQDRIKILWRAARRALSSGNFTIAEKKYLQLIDLDPGKVEFYGELSNVYKAQKKTSEYYDMLGKVTSLLIKKKNISQSRALIDKISLYSKESARKLEDELTAMILKK